MKVLLLQDVRNVGRRMDIKDVPEGYARNFLLPKKLAIPADEKAKKLKSHHIQFEEKESAAIKKSIDEIEKKQLLFLVKTGDKGEVFGSIKKEDIEARLKDEGYKNFTIDLDKPIHSLGSFVVGVGFGRGYRGTLKVSVQKQP